MKPLSKVLIANRGEIAVRVARTCRAMGIATVAVYSEADRGALHTREADEAVAIGPAEAARSYLNVGALVDAARRSGADAVHPGYGFLSEKAELAAAVADAGLVFVGPPAEVHQAMGDKKAARQLMAAAGVPVVPGYDGDDQQESRLLGEAERIGWPVMIKPARGGGGKGMRGVSSREGFVDALRACRREARAAFADEAMVLERSLERPRHVEVQVIADSQGATLHLFERECSIQRRHQKVVEETPSPALDQARRQALCEAGVAAARAVSYRNAGTVEFLLDAAGRFYFLEMNTRLQVEHPVTEATTGFDLVRLQLEVASGAPLRLGQEQVRRLGHALECRIYAEDPTRDDAPSPGTILLWVAPEGPGVRVDSGVATGSEVSVHYDPMLAKLVTWGQNRGESLQRMRSALLRTVVLGVATNVERLGEILAHPRFVEGALHTGFIQEHLQATEPATPPPALAVAAAVAALRGRPTSTPVGGGPALPDPWELVGPWRLS